MALSLAEASAAFLAHRLSLIAYLRGVVRDPAVAEDLFQEVYVALADACARGIDIADIASWSRGVGRNLALQHWKRRREDRLVPASELLERIDQAFAEAGALDEEWERRKRALAGCTQQLPDHARRLLALRYVDGHPVARIAGLLGRTEGALMTALSRLRSSLADCIALRLREEPR